MREGYGVCPVCNGTRRCNAGSDKYKNMYYNYDSVTDTLPCNNCGGQTMGQFPTGEVPLRKDNSQPCKHEYRVLQLGRCLVEYSCNHCSYVFQIDSGD
jgi:hypothetical protein